MWGEWSDWTDCAEACPVGKDLTDNDTQQRSKECVWPDPDNKGDGCVYGNDQTIVTNYGNIDYLNQERLCSETDCPSK